MNTQIYMWLQPLVMNNRKCYDKVYFNYTVEGDKTELSFKEIENIIEGENGIQEIMNYADILGNWDYGVIETTLTDKFEKIVFAISPEQQKIDKENKEIELSINKIVNSKEPIVITNKNITVNDGGLIDVKLPHLKISDKIDFTKIWNSLENDVIGKIKNGDEIIIKDEYGNKILEVRGGNFLEIAFADLKVYDRDKHNSGSFLSSHQGLKGGLYIRDDGSLDIGDVERTFYMRLYTNNLLKTSLKLKKSLISITADNINKLLNK